MALSWQERGRVTLEGQERQRICKRNWSCGEVSVGEAGAVPCTEDLMGEKVHAPSELTGKEAIALLREGALIPAGKQIR